MAQIEKDINISGKVEEEISLINRKIIWKSSWA
jgi:hypothetical protein